MNLELNIFYNTSIWLVGLFFLFILLLALEVCNRIGLKQRKNWVEKETSGGKVVLTAMLALLGLILSFTYLASVQRYETRKNVAITEANTLSTSFLRASLVADPGSTELQRALLNYARTRLVSEKKIRWDAGERTAFIDTSTKALKQLWPITEKIISESERTGIEAALVKAINNVYDSNTLRIAAAVDKLPIAVTVMMLLMAAAALGVAGFNAGVYGKMSRGRMTTFALVLTLIMTVIQDFDRPLEGWVRVPQDSLRVAILEMEEELELLNNR